MIIVDDKNTYICEIGEEKKLKNTLKDLFSTSFINFSDEANFSICEITSADKVKATGLFCLNFKDPEKITKSEDLPSILIQNFYKSS